MKFSEILLSELQHKFFVAFQIVGFINEDKFSITFAGDDSNSVVMDLFIKSDSRLKITLHTGNYAAELLQVMSAANQSRKKLFVEYWHRLNNKLYCQTKVHIGDKTLSENEFLEYNDKWGVFSIQFESFPFYDPDDDNRADVVSGHVCDLWAMLLSLIPYTIEGKSEGTEYEKTITTHERNPINRQLCLQLKGYACAVCGVKFEDVYGSIGHNYIEVHHMNPVADMGEDHVVDVINELVPLCSNCHSMAHRRRPPYSVAELREFIARQKQSREVAQVSPHVRKEDTSPSITHIIQVIKYKEDTVGKRVIPLYSLRAACGKFLYNEDVDVLGWLDADEYGIKGVDNMFVVQARGHSMEPVINDGDYCVFVHGGAFYNGDIILAEMPDKDKDYGGSYTIKRYSRIKGIVDGIEQRTSITLIPINPQYESIVFDSESGADLKMVGTFVKVLQNQ